MSEEFSFEVKPESIEELKKAINYDELNEISKRFDNGTETEDDIINHCRNYGIEFENGNQLFVVEKKYFDKVVDLYQKEKDKNKELQRYMKTNLIPKSTINLLYISKNKIREKQIEREFELQQEYKDFEEDIEWKTYKRLLEENNGKQM